MRTAAKAKAIDFDGDLETVVQRIEDWGASLAAETAADPVLRRIDGKRYDYAQRIKAAWQKTVESILEVGQTLIEAKEALPHGGFEEMVKEDCPFGIRSAQMFMKIAAHPALSNTKHVSRLPASWGTLYELSKFEEGELKHALSNHWVKPEMPREDVPQLHKRVQRALGTGGRARACRAAPAPFDIVAEVEKLGSHIDRLRSHVRRTVERCPAEHLTELDAAIDRMVTELMDS